MSPSFSFAAIDFETTGSVAGYPVEPWQVGIVVMRPGAPPIFWESLLRIGERPFHPKAPGRHAKLRDELAAAPTLEACLTRMRELCAGRPLVAHNAATERKCLQSQLPMERWGPWIDTLKVSRAAWPTLPSHKLEEVLSRLGLMETVRARFPEREPHDALFDAYASAVLLQHLLQQPGWKDASLDLLRHPDLTRYYR